MKMILLLTSFSLFAHAGTPLNTMEQAQEAQENVLYLMDSPGVTSIGIGGCDPQTGIEGKNAYEQFIYCVIVVTDGPTSTRRLLRTFPIKSKVKGTYIYIKTGSGPVHPQPRMSGGS
jgi:hypothetical protein